MERQGTRVFLVGAGPGNPGLLTLRAVECLEQADLVIYDRLANAWLLDHAPSKARRVCVTELASHHVDRCRPVIDLMIEAAKSGQCVVRVKGGDPLVFGRGGEEAEALFQAGIPFEIIPGVTAALGAAAYAGFPLTHRDHASAIAFVTGHERGDKEDHAVDWAGLVSFPGTLVIYMGLSRLSTIVGELIAAGKDPKTPAAVIQAASTTEQKVIEAALQELPQAVEKAGLGAPAVVIIGAVVGLRSHLSWFEKRPLFGRSVLVTRPEGQGHDLARRLEALGARAVLLPVMSIREPQSWAPVDAALDRLENYQWLVFTSVNGVEFFLNRLRARGRDLRSLGGIKLAAIGPATAGALRRFHLEPDLVPESYRSEALALALRESAKGTRVLLVRADRGREILREELSAVAEVDQVAVYSQVEGMDRLSAAWDQVRDGKLDYITFTSSNIARAFLSGLDETTARRIKNGEMRIVTISPVTSDAVRKLGYEIACEAEKYTTQGLLEALEQLERNRTK